MKGGTVPASRPADSPYYTTIYEVQLPKGAFPGVKDTTHFRISNEALNKQMASNPAFAAQLEAMYPGITKGVAPNPVSGLSPAKAPTTTTTWHHGVRPGQMELVPRAQHAAPGPVQRSLHPNGRGGMNRWGGGR